MVVSVLFVNVSVFCPVLVVVVAVLMCSGIAKVVMFPASSVKIRFPLESTSLVLINLVGMFVNPSSLFSKVHVMVLLSVFSVV
jgi:hypothetical protein